MVAMNLDELDLRLIKLLAKDARVSNRTMAVQLGVAEGTVRGRIKRLQKERMIAFTPITGLEMGRKSRVAFIDVQAENGAVRRVMQDIAAMPEIACVMAMAGEFNILVLYLFDEPEALADMASNRILALADVRRVETAVAIETFKYNARMVRITPSASDMPDPADGIA